MTAPYNAITPQLVERLKKIVGEKYVIFDDAEKLQPYSHDALANNPDVPLRYAYEQGTLQAASGEAIGTKLPNGGTPAGDNEFAEPVGFENQEGEGLVVVDPGSFDVRPAAADTDMDVFPLVHYFIYDIVNFRSRLFCPACCFTSSVVSSDIQR